MLKLPNLNLNILKYMQELNQYNISIIFLGIIIMLLPIDTALGDIFGGISLINYFLILFYAFRMFDILHSGRIYFDYYIAAVFLFVWYMICTYLWGVDRNESNFYLVSLLNGFALYICISLYPLKTKEVQFLKNAILNSWYCVFLYFFLAIYTVGWNSIINASRVYLSVGRYFDPNFFTASLSVLVASLTYRTVHLNIKTDYCKLGVIFFIAFLLGSRGGVISLAISVLSVSLMSNKLKLRHLLYLSVLLLSAYNFLPENVLQRFSISNIVDSDGTGRYLIWNSAINTFVDSNIFRILFGYGFSEFPQSTQLFNVAHNAFVSILLEGGVVGLLILVYMLIVNLYKSYVTKNVVAFSSILAMIFACMSLDMHVIRTFWFVLCLASIDNDNSCTDIKCYYMVK